MNSPQRVELELKVLEHKKDFLDAELELIIAQNNIGMFADTDDSLVEMKLLELVYQRNKLYVEIAQKQLVLFDLHGQFSQAV